MTDKEFRQVLDWYMCSDPWPAGEHNQTIISDWIAREATQRGFTDWVDAYHRHLG